MMRRSSVISVHFRFGIALAAGMVVGCREPVRADDLVSRASVSDGIAVGVSSNGARFVRTIAGLHGPESVKYDAEEDAYFISNMTGLGSAKDGNGYIVRVEAGDVNRTRVIVQGGPTIELHAPKGMTIQGDTLWVADIDVVRGFHRRSGASVGAIDFSAFAPVMLNDLAIGPDGRIRVTDTGIQMVREGNRYVGGDRIFAVSAGRRVQLFAGGSQLRLPNGITWDAGKKRWIVVSFDPFVGEIAVFDSVSTRRQVLYRAKGRLDGVEALDDGSILYTSWVDSSVHRFSADGRDMQLIREVPEAADIGVDTKRHRVLVPLATLGWVQIWELPVNSPRLARD